MKKLGNRKINSNQIFQGDNLEIMRSLEGGKIDLIYIDPPFCAQNVFKSKAWGKEVSFNDEWGGGINSYVRWLVPRLRECHRLLKETGVFCLHLDQRSSHYAKVELDKIFGKNNLINEIIWCYKDVGGGRNTNYYKKKHDTILIYAKTNKYYADIQRGPLSRETLKVYGRHFKNGILTFKRLKDVYPKTFQSRKKQGRVPEKLDSVFLSENNGALLEDYWIDINPLRKRKKNCKLTEEYHYPTQKPLALLERIIKSFTKNNYLVADFFCGCGTAISAAQKLDRRWLGCDISKDAIDVIQTRMQKEHDLNIEIINTNQLTRVEIYNLNPFEFEKKIIEMLGGIPNQKQVGDGGIDGRMYDYTPIQVKKSENIGRPVIDSFYKHVKEGNGKGIIIAKSFSKNAYDEVDRLFNEFGLQIDLVPSDDIIRDSGESNSNTETHHKAAKKLHKARPKRKARPRRKTSSK